MLFRLCTEDRTLFGCPEWLTFDARAISIADLEELSDRFSFDVEDWPEPFRGQLTLDQAGDPNAVPRPPRWRNRALIWMLLRQNGVNVSWDDAGKAHVYLLEAHAEESDAVTPGKDGPESSPSESSDGSTIPHSSTSTDSDQPTLTD